MRLFADAPARERMGSNARRLVEENRGALVRLLSRIDALL
jgi:hypothetical protein